MARFVRTARSIGLAALACAVACSPSRALEITRDIALPVVVADGVLQIGERRLHLPAGRWVLTGGAPHPTEGKAMKGRDRYGEGFDAWATLVEDGQLRALVWLGLPFADFPREHRIGGNDCVEDGSIERLRLSDNPRLPECLGVYGYETLAALMANRSPRTVAWLRQRGIPDPGTVVRFVYKLRTDDGYGGVAMVLPAAPFASDDDARRWVGQLREACRPLFEGRAPDASLPPLPRLPEAPASAASAAR